MCNGTWADFAKAPTQQQQADRDHDALVGGEGLAGGVEAGQVVEGAELAEDEQGGEDEADVADDVDHERLHPGRGRCLAPVPEADQRVGGEADERPAHDQEDVVAGQDQQQHREDEEVEVGEEARVAAVRRHVGERVEVDQGRDPRDHQAHEDRERVDEDAELDVEPGGVRVAIERVDELAVVDRVIEQRDQGADRAGKGERDRGGAHPGRRLAREGCASEGDHQAPREREGEHEPGPGGRRHQPRSSRISSTSRAILRRNMATISPSPTTTSQAATTMTTSANT